MALYSVLSGVATVRYVIPSPPPPPPLPPPVSPAPASPTQPERTSGDKPGSVVCVPASTLGVGSAAAAQYGGSLVCIATV